MAGRKGEMGTSGAVVGDAAVSSLVGAAAAVRWCRPDLTATLAELALDAATDAGTWVTAAGWFLHGRVVLGDGRDTAGELLDGLGRWGDTAHGAVSGPAGRRLRVELAGLARRVGEPVVARVLLAPEAGGDSFRLQNEADTDLALRADVLTELARCVLDGSGEGRPDDDAAAAATATPDTAETALRAAEEAWRAVPCAPGVASVLLLRAARDRRIGRPEVAAARAVDGLAMLVARGRREGSTTSDHLAAALTAEWIAALVDAGRIDDARTGGVPAATRLVAEAVPSRQTAGLRLAIARVAAAAEDPEHVLAALEPAAEDAAVADVPELESACRSMLGELHEAAGRLDAALAALRAAMTTERRDRDRGARLRTALTAWTARLPAPARNGTPAATRDAELPAVSVDGSLAVAPTAVVPPRTISPAAPASESPGGAGRRARRLAAEAEGETGGSATDGAVIGDALWRELIAADPAGNDRPEPVDRPSVDENGQGRHARPPRGGPDELSDGVVEPAGRPDDTGGDTGPAADQASDEHRSRRPASTDVDGLGLGDLLAGALAAYRNL